MGYTVSRSAEHELIEVSVRGPISQGLRKEILFGSADALRYACYHRLLIDVLDSPIPSEEAMSNALPLVTLLQGLELPARTRIAFLYADAEGHRNFFEQAAQSGGINLSYFRDRAQALEWLKEE